MNYKALKWMIDNLTSTYTCPECSSNVEDGNVDIIWAAGTTINIDVECSNCGKHSMIKSEIITLDLSKIQNIAWLQGSIEWVIAPNKPAVDPKLLIKDEQIVELNKNLKKTNLWVEDLFKTD